MIIKSFSTGAESCGTSLQSPFRFANGSRHAEANRAFACSDIAMHRIDGCDEGLGQ